MEQKPFSNQDENLVNASENSKSSKTAADILLEQLAQRGQNQEGTISSGELKQVINQVEKGEVDTTDVNVDKVEAVKSEKNEVEKVKVNYKELSKEELANCLKQLAQESDIESIKLDVKLIVDSFYQKVNQDRKLAKEKFILEGGDAKDFKEESDSLEENFKQLYNLYRKKYTELKEQQEKVKEDNLKAKYDIIEKIKKLSEQLVNSQENFKENFDEFKNLQKSWKEIGLVPQTEVDKLWDSYHYEVEKFYDNVKINKELRDLDLKRNTELKVKLCDKAEELIIEPKIIKAFKELQLLHEKWKEIGPVVSEQKEVLWARFKAATNAINKKHQEFFDNLKAEQENNYKAKTLICEKAEEIVQSKLSSNKEWEAKSNEILELQKLWKLIGFAPKKYNNKVYERFRESCDKFFEQKRDFYAQSRQEYENNLQLKTDLCVQAESLKDSTDWKKTADIYISLQKKWTTIGPVPRKYSEEIWQRFRAACNYFFDNKAKHFSSQSEEQVKNLELKNEIIAKIDALEFNLSQEENLAQLKKLQGEFLKIGHVPFKQKDDVQERYRKAVDQKLAKLNIDELKRAEMKTKSLIEGAKNNSQSFDKLIQERDKMRNKAEMLNQKISLWENNLGFFAKSKDADKMVKDFMSQIEKTKAEIATYQKQISQINKAINELKKSK